MQAPSNEAFTTEPVRGTSAGASYDHMFIRLRASTGVALLSLVAMFGCSQKPVEPPRSGVQPGTQETASARQRQGTSEEEVNRQAVAANDGPIDALFKENAGRVLSNALEWAGRNPKTLRGGSTLGAMLTSLSDAGAQRIIVLTNWPSCDYLIILTLPSETAARQKVFASDERLREVSGMEKTRDFGQKYLGYRFFNSMFKPTTAN